MLGALLLVSLCARSVSLRSSGLGPSGLGARHGGARHAMPGQSTESIPEAVARARTGWPHWHAEAAEADAPAAAAPATAPAAPAAAPAAAPPRRATMPGQSLESIPEDVARARTGWPHWHAPEDKETAPAAAAAPVPIDSFEALQRAAGAPASASDVLLKLSAAAGRLSEVELKRGGGADVEADLAALLLCTAQLAALHKRSLRQVAQRAGDAA
ncbi:hypothetical protein M885DRAFT_610441 [Pelagophyceae sp. CCMP2097]|nr:hypothetical protein M885DRAFT_610441 [Pelagophyceae sp. CCMP2097]